MLYVVAQGCQLEGQPRKGRRSLKLSGDLGLVSNPNVINGFEGGLIPLL